MRLMTNYNCMTMLLSALVLITYVATKCNGMSCTSFVSKYDLNQRCKDNTLYAENISCRADFLCSSNCSEPNLSWKPVDSNLGMLEVSYQLPGNNCSSSNTYTITLLSLINLNNTTCNPLSPGVVDTHSLSPAETETHSCRRFTSDICNTQRKMCGRTVVMTFKYVYTGCYLFKIVFKGQNHSLFTTRHYIVTNFTKTAVKPITFNIGYTKKSLTVDTSINEDYMPAIMDVTLHKAHCRGEILHKFQLNRTAEVNQAEVLCKTSTESPRCIYQGYNGFTCTFSNIPPMNYCVAVEFEEDRCQSLTLWTQSVQLLPCYWTINYNAVEVNDTASILEPSSKAKSNIIIISSIYLIIAIIVIGVMIYKGNYKRTHNCFDKVPPVPPVPSLPPVFSVPTVMLLYARDCPQFMAIMEQFRTVLSITGCQVYDYWDPMRFDEVAESMTGWVRKHMENKEVRFMVISTPISRLLDQSLKEGRTQVGYREPHRFDMLYLFTLKCLEEIAVLESYNRIFVVSLENITPSSSLTYLSPMVVYSMPTHLDTLLYNIKNQPFGEFTDVPTMSNFPEVKEFISLIKELERRNVNINDMIYYNV